MCFLLTCTQQMARCVCVQPRNKDQQHVDGMMNADSARGAVKRASALASVVALRIEAMIRVLIGAEAQVHRRSFVDAMVCKHQFTTTLGVSRVLPHAQAQTTASTNNEKQC